MTAEADDATIAQGRERLSGLASEIVSGRASKAEMVAMLRSIEERGLTSDDVLDLAMAFRQATVQVETCHEVVADLCGTGGGSVRSFNISTAASFVVAGCGVPVAKHGNRSNAGQSGSADVMEAAGARLVLSPQRAAALLDEVGIAFFFAPTFNPAMRNAAAARREVGGKTVFNVLGPLLNPVRARRRQLIGVYDRSLLDLLPPVLAPLGIERAILVHGRPGLDEVSTLGPTEAVLVERGKAERFAIDPMEYGYAHPDASQISDRSAMRSAILMSDILHGKQRGAPRDVVVLNAACGLLAFGRVSGIGNGIRMAEAAIDSGRAARRMEKYIALSRMNR